MSKMQCPACHKNHKTIEAVHRCIGRFLHRLGVSEARGTYDEIKGWGDLSHQGGYVDPSQVRGLCAGAIVDLFREVLTAEYCDFDRRGLGSALNHDLYGYDPGQGVAVIQARQCIGNKYGKSSRKTYFLVGHNEGTGRAFRHPVSSWAVRAAINAGADAGGVVRAAQRWMWGVTELQLSAAVRQGDVLLVPERGTPAGELRGNTLSLDGSHVLDADEIRVNGRIYARNPQLIHAPGQHATVAVQGWCSVRVSETAAAWNFAQRRGD